MPIDDTCAQKGEQCKRMSSATAAAFVCDNRLAEVPGLYCIQHCTWMPSVPFALPCAHACAVSAPGRREQLELWGLLANLLAADNVVPQQLLGHVERAVAAGQLRLVQPVQH